MYFWKTVMTIFVHSKQLNPSGRRHQIEQDAEQDTIHTSLYMKPLPKVATRKKQQQKSNALTA